MTSSKKLKEILSEIEQAPISAGCGELSAIMKKAGILTPTAGMDSLKDKCIGSLYTAIQTEKMFESCVYAKWSCFCAAVAAIASCISVLLCLFRG